MTELETKILKCVESMYEEDFDDSCEYWESGNFDDAFEYGVEVGEQYVCKAILRIIAENS